MHTKYKIRKAKMILLHEGLFVFIKTLLRYLKKRSAPHQPNESEIAFNALNADNSTGYMVDIGAHHGDSLGPFACSGWKVYAFEPDSKNRERLLNLFGTSQDVVIDSRAVSDHTDDEAAFYRSEDSTGISGLSSFHPSHKVAEKVRITTLSEVFEEGVIGGKIDFLKIDTEGFDLHALRGFPWERSSPNLILCEFEDTKTISLGYTFHDLAEFLVQRGYKLIVSEWHPIKNYGSTHDWRGFATYPCEFDNPSAWGNIFATKDDGIYKLLLDLCKLSS